MTLHLTPVAAKDGTSTTIPGGIQQNDRSGGGTGPNDPVVILIDSTANEILGTTADAAATQTDTTSLSFMSVVKQISKSIQAAAASLVTLVGANATAVEQALQLAQETATAAALGTTAGAAVVTDANGTLQQYLRGLVKLIAAGINVVITNANANILALAGGTVAAGTAGAPVVAADQYSMHKEVAASATATVLGATGAIGDYLDSVTVYPGVVGCGVVTILDGTTALGTFAGGGTTALPSCIPFTISVGAFCAGAGWHITTGANVTVSCKGKFT